VGFCLAEFTPEAVCVRDFMLSCRVQGKLIEKAFFHYLLENRNPLAADKLWVNFRPTPRNQPAQQVLQSLGFRPCTIPGPFPDGMLLSSPESLRWAGGPHKIS
jgi:predicted enzyme involved in methoxymalonyl-ACP biosynthesis